MKGPAWLSKATDYWTTEMGCQAGELFARPLELKIHGPCLADYNGIFALFRQDRAVISFPAEQMVPLSKFLPQGVLSAELLASRFASEGYEVIGPAFIGYARDVPQPAGEVRTLSASDKHLEDTLRSACSETEWDHGGSPVGELPCSGAFEDGHLAALAGYEVWGSGIAHISVVAHPRFRGRGHGRSAVAHLARKALEADLIPQYRTLNSNTGSIRIARSLGFTCYATSVAVRLGQG